MEPSRTESGIPGLPVQWEQLMGKTRYPLLCHVTESLGQSGQLVGYGGGLPIKEALLGLERRVVKSR